MRSQREWLGDCHLPSPRIVPCRRAIAAFAQGCHGAPRVASCHALSDRPTPLPQAAHLAGAWGGIIGVEDVDAFIEPLDGVGQPLLAAHRHPDVLRVLLLQERLKLGQLDVPGGEGARRAGEADSGKLWSSDLI